MLSAAASPSDLAAAAVFFAFSIFSAVFSATSSSFAFAESSSCFLANLSNSFLAAAAAFSTFLLVSSSLAYLSC
jgi:hypothetical protein